ncbi:MAG: hypothetical protein R3A52_06850 [Polyangiales bacterium]
MGVAVGAGALHGGGAEVITVSRSVSNEVGVMVYPFMRLAVGVTF